MIKLFISDIDGCIAAPYRAYDLDGVQALARHAREAGAPGDEALRPALSLCSGRAYPYVEAVTQMLGLQTPVLFESGGGLFDLTTATVTWNPALTEKVERQLDEVGQWLRAECVHGTPLMFDYGKRTQRGVIADDTEAVAAAAPRVREHIEAFSSDLCVYTTDVSIDVLPEDITKQQAVRWLADELDLAMEEVAFMGDTEGDLGALQAVGQAFAPANAQPAVKEAVDYVTEGAVLQGTLEAYRWCLEHNEAPTPT